MKCGSTGEDAEGPVAHILPRDLKILKFKSMPVPVDPLPYDNGEEKTVPLYTTPPATQAALTAALDYLWVVVEHNRLHFGDSHNTVIQGQAVVAQIEATGVK